jgi:hypothetical protein
VNVYHVKAREIKFLVLRILRGKIWVGGGKKIKIKRAKLIFIHPKTYINSSHLLLTIHLG